MNKSILLSAFLAASCTLFSCESQTPQTSNGITVIDVDHPNINEPLPNDQIIESAKLIPLKGDFMFKALYDILFSNDRIFILDDTNNADEIIKIFDNNGNLIKCLRKGSGPGEIDNWTHWYWDEKVQRLYVYNSTSWTIFDKDGNFIEKREVPIKYWSMSRFGDEFVFHCADHNVNDSLGNKFYITDTTFNIKYSAMKAMYKTPILIVSPSERFFGQSNEAPWYVRADTVYNVQNTQLVPRYIFKYENRLSDSELEKDVASLSEITGYIPGRYRDNGITQTLNISTLTGKVNKYIVRDKKSGHYFALNFNWSEEDRFPPFYLQATPCGSDWAVSIDDYSYQEYIPEIMPFVSESDKKLLEEFQVEDNPIIVKFKTKEF